jgi:peroxiredoxin
MTAAFSAVIVFSKLSHWRDQRQVIEKIITEHLDIDDLMKETRPTVLLLFSPYDCFRCLEEVEAWDRLHKKMSDSFFLVGIARVDDAMLLKRFADKMGFKFSLVGDSAGSLTRSLVANQFVSKKLMYRQGELVKISKLGTEPHSSDEKALLRWLRDESDD